MNCKKQDLLDSLDKVATFFSALCELSERLTFYTEADLKSKSSKTDKINELLSSIGSKEKGILQEFLLLKTTAEKFLGKDAIKMVSIFKPYRCIRDYIDTENIQKINDEGKDQKYSICFKSNPHRTIQAFLTWILYDGKVFLTINLVLDMIEIWRLFLEHNTDINIDSFSTQINEIMSRKSIYSKQVPYSITEKIQKMMVPINTIKVIKTKEKKAIENDVTTRLKDILFCYNELEILKSHLPQFHRSDFQLGSNWPKQANILEAKIMQQEKCLLLELTHFSDNFKKYFKAYDFHQDELGVIHRFRPLRIASGYVGYIKHGIRGKNMDHAVLEYKDYVFSTLNAISSQNDHLVGILSRINHSKYGLIQSDILIETLLSLWEIFIRNHTNISTETFETIRRFKEKYKGQYSIPYHESILIDAKKLSEERKKLEI